MAVQTIATSATANLTSNGFSYSGYTFSGWNTATNGSGTAYANGASFTMGTSSVTLYAQWVANTNTITFNANGGTGTMAAQTIATNASASLTANAFTYAGYTFAGWNTRANGSGTTYANSASYTMGTASVVLYAQWTANLNTITFNANGGTGTMANQTIATNASASLTANAFTYSGYTFAGWNTQANGSGTTYINGASYTIGTASVVLFAQWINQSTGSASISTPQVYTVTISGPTWLYYGNSYTFTESYTGTAVGYQWYLNGIAISGATTGLYYVLTPTTSTVPYGTNILMLVVTDANGIAYTASQTFTVTY
jgi:uncharacterized repeat protein (TIGR02543 family)